MCGAEIWPPIPTKQLCLPLRGFLSGAVLGGKAHAVPRKHTVKVARGANTPPKSGTGFLLVGSRSRCPSLVVERLSPQKLGSQLWLVGPCPGWTRPSAASRWRNKRQQGKFLRAFCRVHLQMLHHKDSNLQLRALNNPKEPSPFSPIFAGFPFFLVSHFSLGT